MEDDKKLYENEIQSAISVITDRANDLKKKIDNIRDQLIDELEQTKKPDVDLLTQSEQLYTSLLKEMKEWVKTVEKQIDESSDVQILQIYDNLEKKLNEYESDVGTPYTLSRPRIIIGKSTAISPVDVNTAWVYTTRNVSLVTRDGTEIKSHQLDFHVQDTDLTSSGDLLLTDNQNRKIWKLSDKEKFTLFIRTKLSEPFGVHVIANDEILVSMRNPSKVVRLASDGRVLKTYRNDTRGGSQLFECPYRLTQNINDFIWVADKGRVVVMDQTGRRKFTYTGGGQDSDGFDPAGISHNQSGLIVIADHGTNKVHLVDKDGGFLQCLMPDKLQGLLLPRALAHDTGGYLWIGDDNGKVFVLKYI